jgi:hypothetical protein
MSWLKKRGDEMMARHETKSLAPRRFGGGISWLAYALMVD